jgi:hypothetical protein
MGPWERARRRSTVLEADNAPVAEHPMHGAGHHHQEVVMSPQHTPPRWRHVARTGAAVALVIPMIVSASAQATWTDVAPTKEYHCGAYVAAPHTAPLRTQSCVIVHDSPSGAYVQGAVKVVNTNDNPRHRAGPTGYTRLWLDGKPYRNDNCGTTSIAGGQSRWCYGKTMLIAGHNRDVYATGYVWSGAGVHDATTSAHWKISPPPAAFPAAWSNGPVQAAPWHPALRSYSSITCGDTSIPADLPPQSVSKGWTARTQAIVNIIRGPAFGWPNVGGGANGSHSGHVRNSYHYCGRALDAFAPGSRAGGRATGAALAASWRLANWAAHNAAALHVTQVIFYDRIWTAHGGGWRPYSNPNGSGDTLQHRDHVHLSVF